jgi:serine/threonine protein kinase/tetratricopeptide (TPR) repeat protein
MSQPAPPANPPSQLAQFEIIKRLGAGGMAEVFLAKKRGAEGTYKVLVVKRILPSFGASRRFRTMFVEEAQLATRLNHPNVVQVYEFYDGGEEGQLLAMEYVEGPDLGRLMASAKQKGTRIPPWVAAWIIAEAAKGLHYAHEKKDEGGGALEIVHRDVSPQNVLLSFEGAVKIADFGIASAKLFVEEQGVIKGKFGYMSPEQARGEKVDRRSDLYAVGVILWEALTGRPLHGGLGGEALLDIVRSGMVEPPSTYVAEIPPELEAIVMKALAAKRDERYATGRDLAAAIGRALLQRQEYVDASTLEGTIAQLFVRENTRPGLSEPPAAGSADAASSPQAEPHRTQAAAPKAISSLESGSGMPNLASAAPEEPEPDSHHTPVGLRRSPPPADGPREVRHVAVVTLRLHGFDPYELREGAVAGRTLERLRTMLGDIAYKRGMRWTWNSELEPTAARPMLEARAIAGLGANPARAAADAAWLALDTHEALAGIKDDLSLPITASIGIVRGIASGVRDREGHLVRYALHDPARFLADTLGKDTPPGRTWVAGGVYRLVRHEFGWGDAPTLQLAAPAGVELPRTMRIYALERSLSREERLGDVATAASDLVGRDVEKAELHAAYHQAVSEGGSGALTCRAVVGELGIGKTALVATFVTELPPNARLVRVECSPVKIELPLSVFAELVRDIIGTTGEEPFDEVCNIIARAGGGAAQGDASNPMVARIAELATNRQIGGGDDEDATFRKRVVMSGVRNLFAAIALQQPLVVIFEGMQWADKQSLEMLAEIIRQPDPLPILIVFVTRSEDRVAPLLEGLVRIELRGLSTDEQVRLVETRLGVREGVRQVCADLMPRVAGNPFFLLEMVDALLERGSLEIREADSGGGETNPVLVRSEHADSGPSLPQTLGQLVADRLTELPLAEHAIVDWLAIAGGPIAATDLAKLAPGFEEATVRLCARGLCDRKGESIDFRHPLTRDVAYVALDPQRRVQMHRELGEHLAQTSLARGLSAAIVARHFARGESPSRAADFYLEAANVARSGYQTQLAIRYFQRALANLPSDDPRCFGAHEALEAIYRVVGRRRERVRHLESLRRVAKAIGTGRVACLALLRSARFDLDEGRAQRGLPTAKRAAEVAHGASLAGLEIEAEALMSMLLRETGDVQGALAACDRALAACDPKVHPNMPPRARAEVLHARGVLLRWVGRVREAVDSYVDAIAVFRKVSAPRQEARVKNSLAFAMFVQGRYEDAIALALESIQIDLSIGGRFQIAKTLNNIGHAYSRLGDIPRGKAYLQRARDTHERYSDQDGRSDTLLTSAQVSIEQNELDTADSFVRDAAALNAATGSAYTATQEAVTRAALARTRRDPRAAVMHAVEGRRLAENQALVSFHFYALALEAAARVDLGEIHTATLLATTALGAVETLQGCEYGLDIRVLCADALKRAGSPQAPLARQRAVDFASALMSTIRDARLRRLFAQRPLIAGLFDATPIPVSVAPQPSSQRARTPPPGTTPGSPSGMPTGTQPRTEPGREREETSAGALSSGAASAVKEKDDDGVPKADDA